MEFFEDMRRAHADWYTANPLEQLSDEKLGELANETGMTIEELQEYIKQPHIEMTCPLCGQAQTHLTTCKGCGGDAWGGEWEIAHGEDFREPLQERLQAAVSQLDFVSEEQVAHAAKHAYSWGGCLICRECWHNTLPVRAYETCPIKLLGDRALEPEGVPIGLFYVLMNTQGDENQRKEAVRNWLTGGWTHWVETWNTVVGPAREQVAQWRGRILEAAWSEPPAKDE